MATCSTCQYYYKESNEYCGKTPVYHHPYVPGYVSCEEHSPQYKYQKHVLEDQPGRKYDEKKIRLDLLPVLALEEIGRVLTYGAQKYDDRNWEKGISYSRCWGALLRHGFSFWRGEDIDPETGLRHMAQLACNSLFILHYTLQDKQYREKWDDRPKPVTSISIPGRE